MFWVPNKWKTAELSPNISGPGTRKRGGLVRGALALYSQSPEKKRQKQALGSVMEGSIGQGLRHFGGKDIPEGVVGLTWREEEKERIWKEYLEGESLRQ